MTRKIVLLRANAPLAVVGALLLSCADGKGATSAQTAAPPAAAGQRLAAAANESWITIGGRVQRTQPNGFHLDYGSGVVFVEMDDWDWYREAELILAGDQVTVSGRIDDDLYERRAIEASSVYVQKLGRYFYASGADEEDYPFGGMQPPPPDAGFINVGGVVTRIDGWEFTLGHGTRSIRVDTRRMGNNPLDEEGLLRVDVGERVQVWGDLELDRRDNTKLMARGLLILTGSNWRNRA